MAGGAVARIVQALVAASQAATRFMHGLTKHRSGLGGVEALASATPQEHAGPCHSWQSASVVHGDDAGSLATTLAGTGDDAGSLATLAGAGVPEQAAASARNVIEGSSFMP